VLNVAKMRVDFAGFGKTRSRGRRGFKPRITPIKS
jgi:hypothetical protein